MVAPTSVKADEGMWLPSLVEKNMAAMTELGFKLTADDVYNINHACLKDAIIALDGGSCTASFVSSEGLIMTNHHCGYDEIQSHSTVENNLLANGFFAKSKDEELPNPGKTAWLLVRIEDVTSRILDSMPDDVPFEQRLSIVDSISEVIISEAVGGTNYEADVYDMFYDNAYYLFVYEVFKDVRLVAAPPESEGKYGADTDNWMWPRHTGDFTVFRIYTAPDGSPAKYAKENVPFHPKHFLPISLKGYQPGDYTMIWGYPGTTERFKTSFEVENAINIDGPAIYEPLDVILPVINDEMNADDAIRLKYADNYASMANSWKNQKGMVASLKALKVVETKAQLEKELTQWINQNADRKNKYGKCLNEIQEICKSIDGNAYKAMMDVNMSLMTSSTLLAAWRVRNSLTLKKGEKSFEENKINALMGVYKKQVDDKDIATEIKIIMATMKAWNNVPESYRPDFAAMLAKFKGSEANYMKALENSIFISEEKFESFLKKPSNKVLESDPIYLYIQALTPALLLSQHVYADMEKLDVPRRTFLAALKGMKADTPMYPDANSTMRTTFGTVCDYYPADGVHYNYFTTTKGILQKEIPGDPEFDVPAKLKNLIESKDFGQYLDADGTMHVCFLSNNDITGGNSGSPIMNANGELIGLAFDGNWEALSSDIVFNTQLQRCINVDARYVLFIIDKFGGQGYLLNEMDIRR